MAERNLGESQLEVLRCMKQRDGTWHSGCGWVWGCYSQHIRILNSLEKRGLVTRDTNGELTLFALTDAGLEAAGHVIKWGAHERQHKTV